MAIELAKAYVQIVPTTEGIQGSLTEALTGAGEKAGEQSGKGIASGIGKGLGGAAKVAAAGITAAATAAATATGALVSGAADLAAYGDTIDKMSQKVGLSSEAYQEWDYILQISGTEMANMTTGLKTLTNKFDDAKNGSEDAQAMFAKLGISMDDIATMSREDLFGAAIKGFQQMGESTERAALANDLFGKSGQELAPLFNTSAEETEALRQQVHKLGGVLSDDAVKQSAAFQDNLTALKTGLSGMKNSILQQALPSMNKLMQGFTGLITGEEGASEALAEGFGSFLQDLGSIVSKIAGVIKELLPEILKVVTDNLPMFIETGLDLIIQVVGAIIEALPTIIEAIVSMLPTVLPELINGIVSLFLLLVENIGPILDPIIQALPDIINSITDALLDNLPQIIAGIVMLIGQIIIRIPQLLAGIWQTITHFFSEVWQRWLGPVLAKVGGFFRNIWNAVVEFFRPAIEWIQAVWQKIVHGFHVVFDPWIEIIRRLVARIKEKIITPIQQWFSAMWEKISGAASKAWQAIKTVFQPVTDWFKDKFSKAWEAVKRVFQVGGRIFDGIKEGIVNAFKVVVNGIIRGINRIIPIPFNALNAVLSRIHNIKILGVMPFTWVGQLNVPQIPELASGGVLERGQVGLLEGTGAEAVVPLERNTGWIRKVAAEMSAAGPDSFTDAADDMIEAFRRMQIVLDSNLVVGGIRDKMDQSLGTKQIIAGRGVATA